MALWFETKVSYDKMMDNGTIRKVKEPYLCDALSFSEAEARTTEKMAPCISGEFDVAAVKKTKIAEIFMQFNGDKWYLVTVAFVILDERTGAEKKANSQILVAADNFREALSNFAEGMKGTMADYDIVSIAETPIMDVFPAEPSKAE